MSKYHYTYVIIDKTPKDSRRYYIGCRSCKCSIEDDAYMGSCRSLKKIIKQRPEDFKKVILATHYNRYMAIWHECILHEAFDVARSPLFYNQAKQTSTGFDATGLKPFLGHHHTEEAKEKNRQANTGHHRNIGRACSDFCKQRTSEANRGKQRRLGKSHSAETKQKISEAKLDKHKGAGNPMYGKKHSLETIEKIKVARRKYLEGKKNGN